MADPLFIDPRMNVISQDAKQKTQTEIFTPSSNASPFFKKLTKDLRLANIDPEDREWFRQLLMQVSSLFDLYIFMGLDEQANEIYSEFLTVWTSTASDKGWMGDHLGDTTGTSRTHIYQSEQGQQQKKA